MKGPLNFFFKLGDKVTRGDPKRQQDFMYYMLWILFLAFSFMFASNLYHLIRTPTANYAIWTMVGFAIAGLQFFSLKSMYDMKQIREGKTAPKKEPEIETVDEMMDGFNKSHEKVVKKEVNKDAVRKKKESS